MKGQKKLLQDIHRVTEGGGGHLKEGAGITGSCRMQEEETRKTKRRKRKYYDKP